jgi:hypothetical protein
MRLRVTFGLLALLGLLTAADKKQPQGHGEDDSVSIDATILSPDQVKQAVGSDFGGLYAVLELHITGKGGKPYIVHLDDFILRSEASGEHSGPLLAGQVAGAGEMVVQRKYGNRSNPESPAILDGMKLEMKDGSDKGNGTLDAVKKKMLAEQTSPEPQSGLLFFPLEKAKPRSLVLSCTTPAGKLRIQFR